MNLGLYPISGGLLQFFGVDSRLPGICLLKNDFFSLQLTWIFFILLEVFRVVKWGEIGGKAKGKNHFFNEQMSGMRESTPENWIKPPKIG